AFPIVVVTAGTGAGEVASGFDAVEAGALAVVPSPVGVGGRADEAAVKELLNTVRVMSEVKVVRRWKRPRAATPAPAHASRGRGRRVVAVGASTGGPIALVT